jgi:hypothetical protein
VENIGPTALELSWFEVKLDSESWVEFWYRCQQIVFAVCAFWQ